MTEGRPWCCWITCYDDALFTIHHLGTPPIDDTEACLEHVTEFMADDDQVYLLGSEQTLEEQVYGSTEVDDGV